MNISFKNHLFLKIFVELFCFFMFILSLIFLVNIGKANADSLSYDLVGIIKCEKTSVRAEERMMSPYNKAGKMASGSETWADMFRRSGDYEVAYLELDAPQTVTCKSHGSEPRSGEILCVGLALNTNNENPKIYPYWSQYNNKHVKVHVESMYWPSDGGIGILEDATAVNPSLVEVYDSNNGRVSSQSYNQSNDIDNIQNQDLGLFGIFINIGNFFENLFSNIFNSIFALFGCSVNISDLDNGGNSNSLIKLSINQIDTASFPDVSLYANVKDSNDKPVSNIANHNFKIKEFGSNGTAFENTCKLVDSLKDVDEINANLVMDRSSSMNEKNKMPQAKNASKQFIDEATNRTNTNLELTLFDNKVYNKQPFTNNKALLNSSIDAISTSGSTALYDALYWALQRTALRNGTKFVIAFTDGEENSSKYTEHEVIELSKKTGIPVYVVGVGDSIDKTSLQNIAKQCNGKYFDCATSNMDKTLSGIYSDIYNFHESLYRIVFTSQILDNLSAYRNIELTYNYEGQNNLGSATTSSTYCPKNDISLYDNKAVDNDYVLPDSNSRYYSEEEFQKMSIWDLYLARNEIYARHGRDFRHRDLREYFSTKKWYSKRYDPDYFDANETKYFNDYERKNADLMLKVEKSKNSPYLVP